MRFLFSVMLCGLAGMAQAGCPGQTQLEMNDCAKAEFTRADADMNATWDVAKATMDGLGYGDVLLDAQRKWLAFRDAACAAEISPYEGGSIQPLVAYTCLTRLTRARSQDLENFRF